jgi:glycosyltransferase involved in cell wall biosynthesis
MDDEKRPKLFISVVIPTRNRLATLRKTLACLERQTYPSDQYEVIVVDDGSRDDTTNYLSRLAELGTLHYIHQHHRGPAAARNAGVRAARGEVVAFTDDDCLPDSHWLAALAESYTPDRSPRPVAVGGRIENVPDGHCLFSFYSLQGKRHQANNAEKPVYLDTANASFQRSTFLTLGGFSEAFSFASGEDLELGLRFTAAGYELHTNPQALVRHVGRTSLWGMVRQSFNRGRGDAVLMAEYPERFASPPSRGLRLRVRRFLDHLLRLAWRVPRPVQPFACGLTAALRRTAFAVPETEHFVRTYFRKQVGHYRALGLAPPRMLLYLLLEWWDYAPRPVGQVVETFRYSRRQARSGRKVPQ